MARLSRQHTPDGTLIGASAPDATGIVHLGLGNFHRAHAAVYTAQALARQGGDWGIVGFANRSRTVIDALAAQDGRYALLQLAEKGSHAGVVDVHRGFGALAEADGAAFLDALADPAHRIVTLTVSEVGYSRSARTGTLDLDSAGIAADLADPSGARTAIGALARGLERRAASGAPIAIQSCDNLQSNGTVARALVTEFLDASGASSDVLSFVESRVSFPNSMVDRIAPATTDATIAEVERLLGVEDAAPVPAEEFSMWVIEDDFAAGRPAWDEVGAVMSDGVHAYELVKLRLLNGSHSLIAYLGILDTQPTIADSWAQPFVREAVLPGIRSDYLPSIALPRDFDVDAYIDSLSSRWGNSAIHHRSSQVGTDGSTKLLQRIPDAAAFAFSQGRMPHLLALAVAAWISVVAPPPGFDPGPLAAEVKEPARDRLAEVAGAAATPAERAAAIVRGGFFPESLASSDAFVARVGELAELIVRHGPAAAARDAVDATAGAQR